MWPWMAKGKAITCAHFFASLLVASSLLAFDRDVTHFHQNLLKRKTNYYNKLTKKYLLK